MYSMFNDEQADGSLTPPSLTLMVYRGLVAVSVLAAVAAWVGGWGVSTLDMICNALWVGLSGWLGSLIFCETMIVGFIVVQSLQMTRREFEGHQSFDVPVSRLPDFSDLRRFRL
jgi:hypothetical protein